MSKGECWHQVFAHLLMLISFGKENTNAKDLTYTGSEELWLDKVVGLGSQDLGQSFRIGEQ